MTESQSLRKSASLTREKPPKAVRERLKKEARKVRRRERAGRAEGERATPLQLLREGYRASLLRVGKNSRKSLNRILARSSRVGDPAWFERDQFPWMKELEDNWEKIRDEAENLLAVRDLLPAMEELSPDHDRLTSGGTWRAFFLHGYGARCERSCARCPETTRLLDSVPGLSSAFFSILAPGSHLPRHRGPTKAIITWHLALKVPEPREKCWIEVDWKRRLWEEGQSLVFDDAQKHEVLNDTDEERVVLLLHFARPMNAPGSWIGRALMAVIRWSPFVSDGKRNQQQWEDSFEAAMGRREALMESADQSSQNPS
jgi:beta-hydroxylase